MRLRSRLPPAGAQPRTDPGKASGGRRRGAWIGASVFAVVAAVAVWAFVGGRQPRHAGKSVTEWALGLNSADLVVRSNAAAALRAIGPDAVPVLARNLRARDSVLKQPFVENAPRLSLRFRRWFGNTFNPFRPAGNRLAAARALALFGTNAPVAPLIRALHDPERQVAAEAATALGGLGPTAVPALIQASADTDDYVRSMACDALTIMRPPPEEAIPALIARLGDSRRNIREQAASALVMQGRPAVTHLFAVLRIPPQTIESDDPARLVRSNALAVLQQIDPVAARAARP